MRVYRFEKPDGGGPWFTKDGILRNPNVLPVGTGFTDPVLYGCASLEELFSYFREPAHKVNLTDCEVRVYEVPEQDIIHISPRTGQIVFPKTYKPIF